MSENDLFFDSLKVKQEADCLYTKQDVIKAVQTMAQDITGVMSEMNPVVLAVMNGGLIPMGLLAPELDFPMHIDYIHATRYRNKTQGGELQWLAPPKISLQQRNILLVDDIHDEGITLHEITNYCLNQGAKSVYSAVLVNKRHQRKNDTSADFVALEVPDRYVFGFGMDYKGLLRNAAGIYAVKGM